MRHPAMPPQGPHAIARPDTAPASRALRLGLGLLAVAIGTLAACSTVPDYKPPKVEVPQAFKEAALFQPANPDAANVSDEWWRVFNDAVLNDLVDRLNKNSPSLQSAAASVNLAQAALASSRAAWFPAISLSTASSRNSSVNTTPGGTSYNLQGSLASWELDLWNRAGAGVEASQARLQASQDTLAAARLSLQATVAQSYFSARSAQAQQRLLEQTVAAYEKSLQLTRDRYSGGVTSSADVAQAEVQLKSAQLQLRENTISRAQLTHAMATLLGVAPASFTLAPAPSGDLPDPPIVPVQLPAHLIERRPDIAAAERQMAAANAQIGAARSAFFPTLSLAASAGYRGSDYASIVQSANRFWSIGPTVALNLFSGGAQSAAVDSAQATYEQTVANYRQTVLAALQEVEDNLATAWNLQAAIALQKQAVSSALKSLDVAQHQYKAGMVSYLNVASAQSAALSAQTNLLNLQSRHLAATSQLLKNLAGRWQQP
jgi:NodT family efflux transporter outer membrane factor (OMF) lipoprotein